MAELLLDNLKMVLQLEIHDLQRNLQEKKNKKVVAAAPATQHIAFCRE